MEQEEEELGPSELGTREYWCSIYERDRKNYINHGDVGEIWFGEESEMRVLSWMTRNDLPNDSKIIDLGCGNGMMLIELAREGYNNLTGVDYCEDAIELCKSIIESQSMMISLKVADLTGEVSNLYGFDIALDKGTYDAISLNPEDTQYKRQKYIQNVATILRKNGLLIITSCNWTAAEIIKHFNAEFKHKHTIPTPSFKFGGKVGNVVSTVVLEKLK
ncbi:EEF1A lysine methyltransferase 2 [Cimex lectularius]|uniref:Protein-lysine N-methyltransferase 106670559 n=1 Tax=Cimex lectularius TaxID=79782 RepID=A0A8I6S3N1_CIMLE|nr:EEF1A lysine methyltransferase 2 [Cimex lectularius]